MSEPLTQKYGGPVPRYTSYPTAQQFTSAVDGETYARWLGSVPAGTRLSLYVHIPFCRSLCWFCGCNMSVANRYERVRRYLDLLDREAELVAAQLPPCEVSALHWGGGTPTMLWAKDVTWLTARLRRHFQLRDDIEFSVEVHPRGLTKATVAALGAAGVTRASLGVQDLDPEVQAAINRHQSTDETLRAATWLREAGVKALNVDLMYGLPRQSAASVRATVSVLIDQLEPDRIAVFGYAHVPWMKRHQRLLPEESLPNSAQRLAQAEAIQDALRSGGYRAVGLDHYAKPDDPLMREEVHRNFQGYTTDDAATLIGLGASAISTLPDGYAQNEVRIDRYLEAAGRGRLATARGVALRPDDHARRAIIERLMCRLEVDVAALADAHGRTLDNFAPALAKLRPLVADGLAEVKAGRVRVTEKGRPFLRVAASAFDSYFEAKEGRHSVAV